MTLFWKLFVKEASCRPHVALIAGVLFCSGGATEMFSPAAAIFQDIDMENKEDGNFLRRNGLTLVLLALLSGSLLGQVIAGRKVYNQELAESGRASLSWIEYLGSGHFISATFENWESEFLQMGMYILLTVSLRQKGSAESRQIKKSQEKERIEQGTKTLPVRAG